MKQLTVGLTAAIIVVFRVVYSNKFLYQDVVKDVVEYEPSWGSLDKRPIPEWYDDVKIGIFLHWGVYSVPSVGTEWFWMNWKGRNLTEYVKFMKKTRPDGFTYQEFAKEFTAEFFNPNSWAKLFLKSGAKYVILTAKHHEGYTLWPSKYSFSWNSQDVGPHRDLVGDLAKAVRDKGLRFGLYYSLYEWFNPLYLSDKEANFTKKDFVHFKVMPELHEIVEKYKPEILWSDGEWEAEDTYWESKEFLTWLYNESPVKETVLVNDRWGSGTLCHHGDFHTCADRYNPGTVKEHKWENAMTVDRTSWAYRRNTKLSDYLTTYELIKTLVETVSLGGNILINIGPTKEGSIIPIFQERLYNLGTWLSINGEAIYKTRPWVVQNDSQGKIWYTAKPKSVYAILLKWPKRNVVELSSANELFQTKTSMVTMLGVADKLVWIKLNETISIILPDKASVRNEWAWVLKITNFK